MILDKKMLFNKVRALCIMTEKEFLEFVHEVECTDRHYPIIEDISNPIYDLITAGIRPKTAVHIIDGFIEKKMKLAAGTGYIEAQTKAFIDLHNYKKEETKRLKEDGE